MKPKFSTGYLTPQPHRKKPLEISERADSSDNLLNFGEISDDLLKKLLSCPIKKKLIVDLITSEKDNIDAYRKKLEKQKDLPRGSPLQKVLKKPIQSPTALLRRKLEQQKTTSEREHNNSKSTSSERSESRQSMASTLPSPVSFDKILEGVIAFVEVKSGIRDRSEGVKAVLTSMGATVRDKFTKDITHVVFKDGSYTTYQKANLLRAKLVSVLWLEACKTNGIRVAEKEYPAIGSVATYDKEHNQSVICSQMQKDYEEIIREEFNRSIASGKPLPSVKSLIERRRTYFPNGSTQVDSEDHEVANIMRRTIHGSSRGNLTPESQFDDHSDTGAIIDGDILESLTHQKISPQDMDLTNIQGEVLFSSQNDNLYSHKTPNGSYNESPNLLYNDIYKRKTELFGSKVPSLISKEASVTNEDSPIISQESPVISREPVPFANKDGGGCDPRILTPRTIRIFSKNASNVTPDLTHPENSAVMLLKNFANTACADAITSIPEKSSSTVMSSLRISDNSAKMTKNVNSVDTVMSELQLPEKSSTTVTTSESCNDLNKIDKKVNKNESMRSSKNSFSPLPPCTINNIIDNLSNESPQETFKTSKKNNSIDNHSKDEKNPTRSHHSSNESLHDTEDLILETPDNRTRRLLSENVTIRKVHKIKPNPDYENTEELFSKELRKQMIFSSGSDDIIDDSDDNKNFRRSRSLRNRRKPVCFLSKNDFSDAADDKISPKKKTNNLKNRRKSICVASRILTPDIDIPPENKDTDNLAVNTRNRRKTLFVKSKNEELEEEHQRQNTKEIGDKETGNQEITAGLLNESNNKEIPKKNLKVALVQAKIQTRSRDKRLQKSLIENLENSSNFANTFNSELDTSDTSPAKKSRRLIPKKSHLKETTLSDSTDESCRETQNNKKSSNRRYTIGGVSIKNVANDDDSKNKKSRRTMSEELDRSKESDDSKNSDISTRKLRKLYDPLSHVPKSNSDEQEREEKRRGRKVSDPGVFIRPSIFLSQKAKEYSEKHKLNIESIFDPISTPLTKAGKKNDKTKESKKTDKRIYNSDDDEQVELKKFILNGKKNNQTDESDESDSTKIEKKDDKNKSKRQEPGSSAAVRRTPRIPKIPNTPRTPRNATKLSFKQTSSTHIYNRRSTLEFQTTALSSAKKRLKIDKAKIPSIVCTKMHKEDVQVFTQIVKKLGRFNVEDEVSDKTTHLVAGEPKRTINMLRAVAMGCWILKKEWLFRSLESGKWLPEEDFEETDFSSAVQENRLQRQAFGPSYTVDIFQDCGPIYIYRGSTPRCSDLQELVTLCKGKITKIARSAVIAVGEYVKYEGVTSVRETWILDCLTFNKKLPFKKYLIKPRKSIIV